MTTAFPARFDAIKSTAFGSITASYTALGTPITHIARILKIVNGTDTAMFFSFDGTTDNDYIPAGGFTLYDLDSNQLSISVNTQVSVKYETVPTSGSVKVINVFARGQ